MKIKNLMINQEITRTDCGQCGCIVVYHGKHCIFCDAAQEIVEQLLKTFGVNSDAITNVDVDVGCSCGCDEKITMLPAIRICDKLMLGLPEPDILQSAIMQALMNDCFNGGH